MKTIIFFLLIIINFSYSQKGNLYTKESSKLPENAIWSICVDKNNNKFVGTAKFGISKFDSLNFEVYDKSNSLVKGEYISPIFNDSKNNIWAQGSNPNILLKYSNGCWEEIKSPLIDGTIVDICESRNNKLYFCFLNKVIVFDGTSWNKIETPKVKNNYRCIDVSSDMQLAIGHNNGLLIRKSKKWIRLTEQNSELQSYVLSLHYSSNNNLYIGYGGNLLGGLSLYNNNNNNWVHYNKNNSNLSDNLVRDIVPDLNGNLWLATNHGLNKFNAGKITPYVFKEKGCSITDIAIEDNIIWASTLFGLIRFEEN